MNTITASQRVRITAGTYEGKTATVIELLPQCGDHGFAVVEFPQPRAKGKNRGEPPKDAVPPPYLVPFEGE